MGSLFILLDSIDVYRPLSHIWCRLAFKTGVTMLRRILVVTSKLTSWSALVYITLQMVNHQFDFKLGQKIVTAALIMFLVKVVIVSVKKKRDSSYIPKQ